MSLAIRITREYNSIFEWLDNIVADKVLVYEHESDKEISRTHIHMLLVNPECKPDALKARFKKLYGAIDKSDWSFKTALADVDPYITYMSKGVLPPKLSKGYSIEEITNLTSKWVDPELTKVHLVNGKLVKDIRESVKKTKRELLEQMRTELSDTSTTRDILRVIRKVLIANNEVVGQYKQMDYYDAYMMYDRKEDWLSAMEMKIAKKYEF